MVVHDWSFSTTDGRLVRVNSKTSVPDGERVLSGTSLVSITITATRTQTQSATAEILLSPRQLTVQPLVMRLGSHAPVMGVWWLNVSWVCEVVVFSSIVPCTSTIPAFSIAMPSLPWLWHDSLHWRYIREVN